MSLRWSAHISWLFTESPYAERVRCARRAGFDTIETAWPDAAEVAALIAAVAEQRVRVALLNAPTGRADLGELGTVSDPRRRRETERGLLAAAELAHEVGAPIINVPLGTQSSASSLARQHREAVDALRSLSQMAGERGLRLALEPLNELDNPGYIAPTVDAVKRLIHEIGSATVGILFDAYHVARSGLDPVAALRGCEGLVAHVQVSDLPDRRPPGEGPLDLWRFIDALAGCGYDGAIGLEYRPRGLTLETLSFLRAAREPAPWPPGVELA